MRQSGLEGVGLAWAGRLLAVAVATWVGRVLVVVALGRLPLAAGLLVPAAAIEPLLAGLAEAMATVLGVAPLVEPRASDPVPAAVAAGELVLARVVLLAGALGLALAVRLGSGWELAGFGVDLDGPGAAAVAELAGEAAPLAGRAAAGTDPRNCSFVPTFNLLGSLMPLRASSRLIGTP